MAVKNLARSKKDKILHWSLSLSVTLVLLYFEDGDAPHRYVGYFSFLVVLVQQVDRLSKGYKRNLLSDHKNLALLVHNLIWILIFLLALSGWMMTLDFFWGNEWLENAHFYFSWSLVMMIFTHLSGILIDSVKKKRPSWMIMVTSLKASDE